VFRSQTMVKVELVVPEHDIVATTEALAASHLFHVADSEEREAEIEIRSGSWAERASTYIALEQRIVDVMALLGVEPGGPSDDALHLISSDVAARDIDALEQEAIGPVQDLKSAWEKLDRLRHLREQLLPLVDLDVELRRFQESRYLFSMLGVMPADNVERLQTSLEHVPSNLIVLGELDHMTTVVLFGMRRDTEILARAARSAYLSPFELPSEYAGTPAAVVRTLNESIDGIREQIAELQATIHHLHETRIRRLRHLLWRVRASRKLSETISAFKRFRYSYLVDGWVPADRLAELRREIEEVSEETVIETRLPTVQEQQEAPFEFSNPPLVKVFEQLVTTYGYPKNDALDPTPLLALTFPLIFGMMFGDVGHGLLLVLLGLLLASRRLRALKSLAGLGKVVVACGIAAVAFGFLYGSIFGFEDVLQPLWLRPLERTTDILLASVGFGVVTLTLGMVYNVIDNVLKRRWGEALVDRNGVAGIVFFWSLLGLGARLLNAPVPVSSGVLIPLLIVAGVAIALAALLGPLIQGEPLEGSVGMTVMEGAFELFETLLGLLSNTLSYVRIGAFAVAHGALSLVVFILARMVDPAENIGYWIVVALGNLVVIGFEGMIVGIQTLRLEYYELFSKFYKAGGRPYRPLTLVGNNES